MVTVEFQFAIGSKVVLENGIVGTVRGVHIDHGGIKSALVHYVDRNKAVHDQWIEEDDLKAG